MKPDEAIERLQRIRQFYLDTIKDDTAVEAVDTAISALKKQEQAENEWCPDCAEYDKENHCCHRFTKVIRQTVEECKREWANEGWIPVTERLPEEKDAGILKKLGTDKQSDYVLATVEVKGERMTVTACTYDGKWDWNMKYAFPDYKVIAWQPLPKPYTEEES